MAKNYKLCVKCNNRMEDDAEFCSKCGAPLETIIDVDAKEEETHVGFPRKGLTAGKIAVLAAGLAVIGGAVYYGMNGSGEPKTAAMETETEVVAVLDTETETATEEYVIEETETETIDEALAKAESEAAAKAESEAAAKAESEAAAKAESEAAAKAESEAAAKAESEQKAKEESEAAAKAESEKAKKRAEVEKNISTRLNEGTNLVNLMISNFNGQSGDGLLDQSESGTTKDQIIDFAYNIQGITTLAGSSPEVIVYDDDAFIMGYSTKHNGNEYRGSLGFKYNGSKLEYSPSEWEKHKCETCKGEGVTYSGGNVCSTCSGEGKIEAEGMLYFDDGGWTKGYQLCVSCMGFGRTGAKSNVCGDCDGYGVVPNVEDLLED